MASLRVKPVILGRKSDLTEQHLKLPSKVTHIYFSLYLCMNFPERRPQPSFNCPWNDPPTLQVMSYKTSSWVAWCLGSFRRCKLDNPSHTCWTRCINWLLLLARAIHSLLTALWGIHCLFPEPPQVFCFFFSQQVLVITCNRLWRGYKICQPSLAIKSSGRSFGTLPLRILYVPVLLGPFQYFPPCSPLLLSFIAQVGC